jgi:mercuric ion binding protein
MKRLMIFFLSIISFSAVFAQDNKDVVTAHYKVDGICEQCKKRIEDAAYIKGVKHAEWNVDTHDLTLVYKPAKTSAEEVLAAIAKAGHDNERVKATDDAYNKLPHCCQYRTTTENH